MGMGIDIATIPLKVVTLLKDEQFTALESLFASPLRTVASADSIQAAWAAEVNKSGAVVSVGKPVSEDIKPGLVRFSVRILQERSELTIVMSVDDEGLLQGLRLVSTSSTEWTPPVYAKRNRFKEEEVLVEANSMTVKGVLSLPKGGGLHPAVVLLSGGGPFDCDETHGPNKPLKDIAWGLASRGIATLRFDKVTYSHSEVTNLPTFTMSEEYVPYALAAVRILQGHIAVDPSRVFILGHSMGGKVAPRVAAADPSITGLILLAADAQPMQQAAVRVARYLASINPSPANQKAVETIARQSQAVDDPKLSLSTAASELPFGFSASYWLDMCGYDPVVSAAQLNKPMFIAQGGRDYQVTVEDDFSHWKTGLGNHNNVVLRLYAADNHLFFPGEGQSTPADYELPQHVDISLVTDIARWIRPSRGLFGLLRLRRSAD